MARKKVTFATLKEVQIVKHIMKHIIRHIMRLIINNYELINCDFLSF